MLRKPPENDAFTIVVALDKSAVISLAAAAAKRWPRDQVVDRSAFRAMAARREAFQQLLARNVEMNHTGPRKSEIAQHRIEENRLLHSARETIENHATRRGVPAQ